MRGIILRPATRPTDGLARQISGVHEPSQKCWPELPLATGLGLGFSQVSDVHANQSTNFAIHPLFRIIFQVLLVSFLFLVISSLSWVSWCRHPGPRHFNQDIQQVCLPDCLLDPEHGIGGWRQPTEWRMYMVLLCSVKMGQTLGDVPRHRNKMEPWPTMRMRWFPQAMKTIHDHIPNEGATHWWPNGLGGHFSQMPLDLAKLRLKWIYVSDWQSPILSLLLSSPMACCRLEIRLESRSVSEGGRSATPVFYSRWEQELGTEEWTCNFLQAISTGILGMVTHMITWLRFCLHHDLQRLILSPIQAVATSLPNKTIFWLCLLGLLTPRKIWRFIGWEPWNTKSKWGRLWSKYPTRKSFLSN